MVINREYIDDDPIIIRVVRKNNFAVLIVKELENDSFRLAKHLAKKFKFTKASNNLQPTSMQYNVSDSKSNSKSNKNSGIDGKSASLFGSSDSEEVEAEINKAEIGKVIIQKANTLKLLREERVTIDYILFWLSNEGLKRIERIINDCLLTEVNSIQEQSHYLGIGSKLEFLQKIDLFQNLYISAQNAKESKRGYFKKIIDSELPSIEFRYLIRHLKSRMSNLHNTTVIIERKLELARNTFQTAIDANLTDYSRRLDQLMKKFSVIATMFLPLTLISGMWGMNVMVPFQEVESTLPFYMI